jgi:hypothetical protein
MLKTIKKSENPLYTLFVPFTRLWFVDNFLFNLERMSLNWTYTEVVFYNDTNDKELQKKLVDWCVKLKPILGGAKVYMSNKKAPGEWDSVTTRRDRIVAMKEYSKELIGNSEMVLCLEDDTIAPANTLDMLEHYMKGYPDVGMASGVQVGRWAYRVIGAWDITPIDNPTHVCTVPFRGAGAQFVDGVGWYCYLTTTELYKAATYRYEAECLGPDVCFAWDLRKQGYKVIIDWDVKTAHVATDRTFYPDQFVKTEHWDLIDDSWIHREIDKV